VRKPDNKNGDTAPRINARKPFCSPAVISLALKISHVFVPQVQSITLLLPEWVLPTPIAKIGIISETTKKRVDKFGKKLFSHFFYIYFS
jgi:hypothetical protein